MKIKTLKIIIAILCFAIVQSKSLAQNNGVCDSGESQSHPDCDGVCDAFDSSSGVDCNGVCDAFDSSSGVDCNGVCDALDAPNGVDCDGVCNPGDNPSSPDCAFNCNPAFIYLSSNQLCNQSVNGTTAGASVWNGNFCGSPSAEAVFYTYNAIEDNNYTMEISNTTTPHMMAVFNDCSASNPLVCSSAEAMVNLVQGEDYIIAVFPTIAGNTSNFELCIYIPEDYTIGNTGINKFNPQTRLDVNGGVRPGFTVNEVEGNIRWHEDLEVFDGASWNSLTEWDHGANTDIDMDFNKIINLGQPLNATDAANKAYVDASIDDDADTSNEIQVLSKSEGIVTLSLNGGSFTDEVDDADNDPNNEIETWSTLAGIPADIADGDDVDDADNDPNNEIETWSTLAGIPVDIADGDDVDDADNDPNNEIETWSTLAGIPVDIADGDDVDDADNDPNNEIETWNTLAGIPADIADGDDVNDADNNITNELQTLSRLNNIVTLTDGGSVSIDDKDADSTNETISSASLTGSTVQIVEAGNTFNIGLSTLATQWENNGSEIYFSSANVGIGVNNPSELLDIHGTTQIRMNSSGASPHIQLIENSGTDGARINFQSSVETDNTWTLFGRVDNTFEDNTFNIFHNVSGNIVSIRGNGNIGFNGSPNADLHVFHENNNTEDGFKLENSSTGNNWWRMYVSSSDGNLRLFSKAQGSTVLGTFDEDTGIYSSASDLRLKENLQPLVFDWGSFMKLKPSTYRFKKANSKARNIGLIAQDVEKVYPELVTYLEDSDQYLLDYSGLSVVAIQAIREQHQAISNLEVENQELRKELKEIKEMLKGIEVKK